MEAAEAKMGSRFNKFLGAVIFLLIVGIIAFTAIAVVKNHAVPGEGLERKFERPPDASKGKFGKDVQYNLIGKMWIQLKEEKGKKKSTLIVSPWLEYKEDRTFYEEMDRKHSEIKSIISDFFSERTMEELQTMNEEAMKNELSGRINEILIMGKIDRILFNDFQFLVE